jgi:hypothetical protein
MADTKVSPYRSFKDKEKPVEVRLNNIIAAKGTHLPICDVRMHNAKHQLA